MPIISIFYGIAVSMYFGDHPPPHIHIECQGYEALVRISDHRRDRAGDLIHADHIECQGYEALVRISDGSHGERDFSGLVQKDRPVLKLLRDPAYFTRVLLQRGRQLGRTASTSLLGPFTTRWRARTR
jgi:hypothetical protein